MKEIDIVNYDGLYTITPDGDVYSYKQNKKKKLKPQKASQSSKGYFQVRLFELQNDRKGTLQYVHRLVWETFKGDIPKGKQIDHIDGDTSNNNVENLQVVTPRENMNKFLKKKYGDLIRLRRNEFIKLYEELGTYKKVAEVTGIPYQRIYRVIKDVIHKYDKKTGKHITVRFNPTFNDEYTDKDRRTITKRNRDDKGRFM